MRCWAGHVNSTLPHQRGLSGARRGRSDRPGGPPRDVLTSASLHEPLYAGSWRELLLNETVDRRSCDWLAIHNDGFGGSLMWDGMAFSGTKIALVCGERTVAYLRDDKPEIPFPAMWDLPGGGREGGESPVECALREVEEEFGLTLSPADVVLVEKHRGVGDGPATYFCAMRIGDDDVAKITFGDEGQRWELMPISDFLRHKRAVPQLKDRLRSAVDAEMF